MIVSSKIACILQLDYCQLRFIFFQSTPTDSPSTKQTTTSSQHLSSLNWKQQGDAIIGEADGDEWGAYVALSADGMTMAIGAPGAYENEDRPGYVKVYSGEGNGSSRKQLGPKINGTAKGDLFGMSVSLPEDGKMIKDDSYCLGSLKSFL